jgi:hypothetical protein
MCIVFHVKLTLHALQAHLQSSPVPAAGLNEGLESTRGIIMSTCRQEKGEFCSGRKI